MFKRLIFLFVAMLLHKGFCGPNQTDDLTPFCLLIQCLLKSALYVSDFQLPSIPIDSIGNTVIRFAVYDGKWLFLTGRTNGLHGFSPDNDDFPLRQQNTIVYVVDPNNTNSQNQILTDPSSHLNQTQIDTLSVTAANSIKLGGPYISLADTVLIRQLDNLVQSRL